MNTHNLLIHFRNILILIALALSTHRVISKWDETSFVIVLLWGMSYWDVVYCNTSKLSGR